jgi:hypothetical protein
VLGYPAWRLVNDADVLAGGDEALLTSG